MKLTQDADNSRRQATNPEYHKIFLSDSHFPKLIIKLWEFKLLPKLPGFSEPKPGLETELLTMETKIPKNWAEIDKARYRATTVVTKMFSGIKLQDLESAVVLFLKVTARIHFSERSGKHKEEYYVG